MCGITGIVDLESPPDREIVRRMAETLKRRGPDDEGFFISDRQSGPPFVGFGFRRLSIIDLGAGRQPMCNETGSLWIVCNGEIYNHLELRKELEAKGHVFRTHSDIESLLHLYEDLGPDCLNRVNGMFAAAIWDTRNQTLFLARDRLGKKPLYYHHAPRRLIFGSEIKALLAHPECPRELDMRSVSRYLAYEYVPAPHCIYKDIHKLPAGHLLLWKNGEVQTHRYWDVKFSRPSGRVSESALAEELHSRLKEAVRLRLISDVPLGVFLSGGIDSSSIVALMAELMPASKIKTFAIGFRERSFDESEHARHVARHFGTEHHEQIFDSKALLDALPEVQSFLDEPLGDASILPTYLLSKFTRQSVTVALGGDGGDELFAGYPTFQAHRLAAFYKAPAALHEKVILPLAELLPSSRENLSLDFKIKRFLRGIGPAPEIRDQLWLASFPPSDQRALLRDAADIDDYQDVRGAVSQCNSPATMDRLTYLYCKFYLQDDILTKVDRASMACSLEARAPFLDYTFVEFANSIPHRLKLKRLTGKYILKRAMRQKLPPAILARRKKGFGIPVAHWLASDLKPLAQEMFSEERIRRQGIFNPKEITRLFQEHLSGKKDNRKQLWTLLIFQLWLERAL